MEGEMKPQAQIEYKPLSELKELPGNPRTIKKDQFEKLKKSLQDNADYFEARPIILSDRTGENIILAGNQRYKAAKALKMEQVPTITLHGLTEAREREIIIRDNVNNGEWNVDLLANEWNPDELIEWGVEIPDIKAEIEIIEDDAPEVNEEEPAKSKLGEIYQLGEHRLMVGDSTKAEDVAALMGGQMADLLVTDPPYNVAYAQQGSATEMRRLHHRTDSKIIQNDKFDDDTAFQDFLVAAYTAADSAMKPGAAWYIWHASTQSLNFMTALAIAGWEFREILNWVKSSLVLGRQDYQWIHEPCLYGWKGGAGHYFRDIRSETTVFDDEKPIDEMTNKELKELVANYRAAIPTTIIREPKPSKSEEHPTMKPVKLIARLIGNSSREGELVLDLFGGSGTTMIAAEQLNRRCYMMELDPHYADVIIERWQNLTGRKAEKIR
jgi:site-specific DNA-methyltransferase (adenine-specific)